VSSLLAEDRFHAWSGQHYLLLLLTAVGVVAAIGWGRRHRGTPRERTVRRWSAAVALLIIVALQVYWLTPAVRSVRESWPLQLSDLADYTAVYALWTRGPRTAAFTYYVGLTLTVAALVTPALTQPFPDPRWFGFWFRHIFVVWSAVYLVWGLDVRPTWRRYRAAVAGALAWLVVAYAFDKALDANYGYLVEKPAAATPLDWLGPWPWYVVAAMAILLTAWAVVMTLPWERVSPAGRRASARPARPAGWRRAPRRTRRR
jgi:hypothetical integral membrane protein (TIGR02206 family)